MSSISRWYLDAQHSFSFKRYTKFRALHYNQFKAALPSFIKFVVNKFNYPHFYKLLYFSLTIPGGSIKCNRSIRLLVLCVASITTVVQQ